MAKTKKPARSKSDKKKKKKPAPARRARRPPSGDELLIEELGAARQELKRLAREENAVRRELEATLSNERNAGDRLRGELEAVRLDLKTALADLEISRSESQREGARAQALARELSSALEAQRMAEHAANSTREQLYQLKRETDRLRAQLTSDKEGT
jgi:chromosome segregation ATPase